jgi:hypothetical protein
MPVVRISETNMHWLIMKAEKLGTSVQSYIDSVIASAREAEEREEKEH